MKSTPVQLHFLAQTPLVTSDSPNYLLKQLPPSDEFAVSVDEQGNVVSRFGDPNWNFRAIENNDAAYFSIRKKSISPENERLIKTVLIFVIYHPNLFPGKFQTLVSLCGLLRKIGELCTENNILITEFSRFPRLWPVLGSQLPKTKQAFAIRLSWLHRLSIWNKDLGFELANETAMAVISRSGGGDENKQTPYIPPRIWRYQVKKLREFIDEFLLHKANIETAFRWLLQAYEANRWSKHKSPFSAHSDANTVIKFEGGFGQFLDDHELRDFLKKWMRGGDQGLQSFAHFFSLARDIAHKYIINFSLQRSAEAAELTSDCLIVEKDPRLGDVAMLVGETTKTDPDSDARWVVPKHVKDAVEVAETVSRLRCLANGDPTDGPVPLYSLPREPWTLQNKAGIRDLSYGNIMRPTYTIFDENEIKITEDDYKIALSLTPTLADTTWFKIGKPWKFANHQLRRTMCVNMFSSQMVSGSTMQWLMKHATREMTLYYIRNYSALRMNASAETVVITQAYRTVYDKLADVLNKHSEENHLPHPHVSKTKQLLNLVASDDEAKVMRMIKEARVGCRDTLLGVCMAPSCEYGGIESVSKCAGVDTNSPCKDAAFQKRKKPQLIKLKEKHKNELAQTSSRSPRYSFLKREIHAVEIYESWYEQG